MKTSSSIIFISLVFISLNVNTEHNQLQKWKTETVLSFWDTHLKSTCDFQNITVNGRSEFKTKNPVLTLSATTPQNGQTHSNNSSATANEMFHCVWLFCGVGAERVKSTLNIPVPSNYKDIEIQYLDVSLILVFLISQIPNTEQ